MPIFESTSYQTGIPRAIKPRQVPQDETDETNSTINGARLNLKLFSPLVARLSLISPSRGLDQSESDVTPSPPTWYTVHESLSSLEWLPSERVGCNSSPPTWYTA
ncbi:hypothetical protein RRG08_021861 [Elysia crispata]|uniref:Uncharacterized protein n=1 Tax=Elysia crispata TaxID=231223 RepID=A0AAE1AL49_9GAST|nr:hypothetical protein RRG08_021861 [Elysia crispata]